MTVVADTRLLMVFTFPSTENERVRVRDLMHGSLRERLLMPTVVIVEYVRVAGRKIGKESAVTMLNGLKESGADVTILDEKTALLAGELLLKEPQRGMGDAIIAATALTRKAGYVVSDDPHFVDFGLKTRWL